MRKACLAILSISLVVGIFSAKVAAAACASVNATLMAHDDGAVGSGQGISFVQVHPDTVTVKPGCSFTLKNPGGHGIRTSSEKPWLASGEEFTNKDISMGPAGDEEGIFKYTVHVEGIGQLDPRARIKK